MKSNIPFETKVVTIRKDYCHQISYTFADSLYNWCKKNKIKVDEPRDTKTKLYKTFVLTLDTIDKLFLFSNKYLQILLPAIDKDGITWRQVPVSEVKKLQYATIHIVLLDGRLPMIAQWRPCEGSKVFKKTGLSNGVGEWWTTGMASATKIEENKKCVTHFLEKII